MARASTPATPPAEPTQTEETPIVTNAENLVEVKAADGIMLMDPMTGKHFFSDAFTSTPLTGFVQERLDKKELVQKGAE